MNEISRRAIFAGLALIPTRTLAQVSPFSCMASFSILRDFAQNVGGKRVNVAALVAPGNDAHVYNATPDDARKLGAAKLIVVNGLGFEGWIERLLKASGARAPVIVASAGVKPLREGGHIDPHAWQSIANVKIYVANIRDGLAKADAEGAEIYRANAAAYIAELDALEAEVKKTIDGIPRERRRIITTHDSFGYFGATYGFSFIAPKGVSTESEPSAADVAKIIRQIKAEKIPAVFLENVSDPRLMQRIAAETGAKLGGTLFSDSLSAPGGPAATYVEMVRHNLRELSAALGK